MEYQNILHKNRTGNAGIQKKRSEYRRKKALAGCMAAALCITSMPNGVILAEEKSVYTPAEQDDNSIVYFVDCGDYVVTTVGEGEQFGTHNSVTDQIYGKDEQTGYSWGIVDSVEELTGNGVTNALPPDNRGVYTANTWSFEYLEEKIDHSKTETNRYSKNFAEKGIDPRQIQYAFELEPGQYEITVGCVNPWNVSNSPDVTARLEESTVKEYQLAKSFSVPNGQCGEAIGTLEVTSTENDKLTIDVTGTGSDNLCVNVAYILIKTTNKVESVDEANVKRDKENLNLPSTTAGDIELPVKGAYGSDITWSSDNVNVISNRGEVTRPAKGQKDIVVTLTATIASGAVKDTKTFTVTVPAEPSGGKPEERPDDTIVYFVDCGDYNVNTVSDGDQLGTHNSVTEQIYGEDPKTGYMWGIVDSDKELTGNNITNPAAPNTGGVYTANTWANEQLTIGQDHPKTSTNRYTKNFWEKGIEERALDYKFQLENGRYTVTIVCVDPWGCSQSPDVYLNKGKESQVLIEALDAASQKPGKRDIEITDEELTVNVRATGDDNKAINIAYILITKWKEESEEEKAQRVSTDLAALYLARTELTTDISLPTEGEHETMITWESSNPAVLTNDGKVTRPKAGEEDAAVTLTATVTYGDISKSREFAVKVLAESDMKDLQEFGLDDIEITDDYYNNLTEKDIAYLNKFDPDRLLYNFRYTAGYTASEIKDGRFDFNKDGKYADKPYQGGWENSRIGGHTLGHYLAACAQAVAAGYGDIKDTEGYSLKNRLEYLIDELEDCQNKLGTGFIFGATLASQDDPERQFDLLEKPTTADTWVPWYTMHKILNGLVETYKLTGNQTALRVAESLGEWVYIRTSKWNTTIQGWVLGVEYGGMNDCLYELYKYAKAGGYQNADHFAVAAHWFDEDVLFENVRAGRKNELNGRHANCTIPKFMGALNRYRALKGTAEVEKYLEYAEAFWTLVVDQHTYITGGNSECEFFGADNILDKERSHCNCETCNTHNMLKLTRELFRITGDKKYADYYETTFINAVIASMNPDTGMTTYFQPMATGFFKVYCEEDLEKNAFWCCTGTGLENFTKLGDSFYYYKEDKLIVNQYTSSNVTWAEKDITLQQVTDIPQTDKATFTVKLLNNRANADLEIRFRIPDWIQGTPVITINGTQQENTITSGYLCLDREWKDGDTIELTLPMGIAAYTLPDHAGVVYGFKYGPVVLAAELGTDNKMDTYQIGVQCDVCKTKIVNGEERTSTNAYGSTSNQGTLASETLNINGMAVAEFIEDIEDHLVRKAGTCNFILKDTDWGGKEPLKFSPYYQLHNQRYGIYWLFAGADADPQEKILAAKQAGRDTRVYLDGVGIGYGKQTEGDQDHYPHLEETGEGSVGDMAALTRYAKKGGSFSYLFKVDKTAKANYLNCQFAKEDNGKTILIKAGDIVIAEKKLDYQGEEEIYALKFEIPATAISLAAEYEYKSADGAIENRDVLRISFSGADGQDSAKLCQSAFTSTNYSSNPEITSITSDAGTIETSTDTNYRLEVPTDTQSVAIKANLADTYGLLYVDGTLVDDTKTWTVALSDMETAVALKVKAEDHETTADYTLIIVKKTQTPEPGGEEKPGDNEQPGGDNNQGSGTTGTPNIPIWNDVASNTNTSNNGTQDNVKDPDSTQPDNTDNQNPDDSKQPSNTNNSIVIEKDMLQQGEISNNNVVVSVESQPDGSTAENIVLSQDGIKAAKESGKDLVIVVEGTDGYTVTLPKKQLGKLGANLKELDLKVTILNAGEVSSHSERKVIEQLLDKKDLSEDGSCVINVAENKGVTAGLKLTVPVEEKIGVSKGDMAYIYQYNKETGRLEEIAFCRQVISADGSITIEAVSGADYIVTARKLSGSKVNTMEDGVTVKAKKNTIKKGNSTNIKVTLPSALSKTNKFGTEKVSILYKSNKKKIASVSKAGKITAKKKGTALITVTVKRESGTKIVKKIKVKIEE